MSDFEIIEDTPSPIDMRYTSRKLLGDYQSPQIINWLRKSGIAKNQKQAYMILLYGSLALLLLSLLILALSSYKIGTGHATVNISPETFKNLPPDVQQRLNEIK